MESSKKDIGIITTAHEGGSTTEPSEMDHDAPYNEVIDGCGCDYCEWKRRREREADRVDDLIDERRKYDNHNLYH